MVMMMMVVVKDPLINGRTEMDQLTKMFMLLGTPSDRIWKGFSDLPNAKKWNFKNQP